jgi:hypothetical protein
VTNEAAESVDNHDEIPSPEWHREVLADREAEIESGEAAFLTLDQLKERLRRSES